MKALNGKLWKGAYGYQPFTVQTTELEFQFSRRLVPANPDSPRGSNISAVWNYHLGETLVNGVIQGWKQDDARGASAISQFKMSQLASEVSNQLADQQVRSGYVAFRDHSQSVSDREKVKDDVRSNALKGWIKNGVPRNSTGLSS
ncbi:hypothetical protein G7Y79_00009g025710 [Physcia stellaris]|nr:hypothetical protein G7Y79_00009g025710 [Physcia stellaris]